MIITKTKGCFPNSINKILNIHAVICRPIENFDTRQVTITTAKQSQNGKSHLKILIFQYYLSRYLFFFPLVFRS